MGSGRRDEGTEEQRAMREVGSGMEVVGGERKEAGEARRELVAEAAVEEGEKSGAGTTSAKQERGAPGRSAATGSNGRGGASRRKAAGRANGRPGRTARGRLTSRDLELLRFLGRVKLARAEQVALRFAMARSKTYARLALLTAEGLAALERRVPGPAVYYATRTGLAAAALPLGEARMSLATLEHDLAVAAACAGIECAGERLYARTEREMRSDLRVDGECAWRVAVRDTGKGRSGFHWPDLAAYRNPAKGWVAVEVELSQKRAERTRAILAGYRSHPEGLSVVLYLTPTRAPRSASSASRRPRASAAAAPSPSARPRSPSNPTTACSSPRSGPPTASARRRSSAARRPRRSAARPRRRSASAARPSGARARRRSSATPPSCARPRSARSAGYPTGSGGACGASERAPGTPRGKTLRRARRGPQIALGRLPAAGKGLHPADPGRRLRFCPVSGTLRRCQSAEQRTRSPRRSTPTTRASTPRSASTRRCGRPAPPGSRCASWPPRWG